MEDLYLDKAIDTEQIRVCLAELFPDLTIFYWEDVLSEPTGFDLENDTHILFTTIFNNDKKEFGFLISTYRTPEGDNQDRALFIAKKISIESGLRVLVPFTHPKHPGNPYFDIVFENGQSYLADDSNTNFADGTDALIAIVEAYPLPEIIFDEKGKKITP